MVSKADEKEGKEDLPALGFTDRNKLGQFCRRVNIDWLTEQFITEYEKTRSLHYIAKKHGISVDAVKTRLIERGIKINSTSIYYKPCTINKNLDSHFLAWLTGFFEGEGYLRLNGCNYQLGITQSDKIILNLIKNIVGTGSVTLTHEEGKYGKNKACYTYTLSSSSDICAFLKMIQPYIQTERRKQDIALALKRLGEKLAQPFI